MSFFAASDFFAASAFFAAGRADGRAAAFFGAAFAAGAFFGGGFFAALFFVGFFFVVGFFAVAFRAVGFFDFAAFAGVDFFVGRFLVVFVLAVIGPLTLGSTRAPQREAVAAELARAPLVSRVAYPTGARVRARAPSLGGKSPRV